MATIVTVGRNVASEAGLQVPMSDEDWDRFQSDLLDTVEKWCREVYFEGTGVGWSDEWGTEEAYTVIGGDFPAWGVWPDFWVELDQLGQKYKQEAVAVTTGTTRFVP